MSMFLIMIGVGFVLMWLSSQLFYSKYINFRNLLAHGLYAYIMKPVLFRLDPEWCHDSFTNLGSFTSKFSIGRALFRLLFAFDNHGMLEQTIAGIHFANPLGLAAGFDKNGYLLHAMEAVGFGFEEVGSMTGEHCHGNPKPRLFRLPYTKSLGVWYGLKNDGVEVVTRRLKKYDNEIRTIRKSSSSNTKTNPPAFTYGVNIAATNCPETGVTENAIADFVKGYRMSCMHGSYTTINISCPNSFKAEIFCEDPQRLDRLLTAIDVERKQHDMKRPVFIKLKVQLSRDQINGILEQVKKHNITGVVCCNLWKNADYKRDGIDERDTIPEKGGLSGAVCRQRSTDMVRYIYSKTLDWPNPPVIIGLGGIFTAQHAYEKLRAGASLVQMVSGVIYHGPQVVAEINAGLCALLRRDGYNNVSQCVGADYRERSPGSTL